MKLTIYTPGDLIVRRGEIAREMYLISDGIVQIIGYVRIIYAWFWKTTHLIRTGEGPSLRNHALLNFLESLAMF